MAPTFVIVVNLGPTTGSLRSRVSDRSEAEHFTSGTDAEGWAKALAWVGL